MHLSREYFKLDLMSQKGSSLIAAWYLLSADSSVRPLGYKSEKDSSWP